MTLDSDFHSHVSHSSAARMARAAQKRDIRVLGLSEHVFQMHEARPLLQHMPQEGPLLHFATYIEAVQQAAQETPLDIRLGLEVDFIPEKNAAIQDAIQGYPWDFLIGSVHEIDGYRFENSDRHAREHGEALWSRYLQLLRDAVNSGYFSVVSHPVRMGVNNPHLPATFERDLEQLAAAAAAQDVALELNGYDILTYPDLVRRLARACALHHTPISVGSDAHYPAEIARSHAQTEAILREAGINKVRIWKQRVAEDYRLYA